MASLPAEEKLEFLLTILSDMEFNPDYQSAMVKCGINTPSNTQRRLKAIVEADKKFRLESKGSSTRIVDLRSGDGTKKPAETSKSTRGTTRGKKRGKKTREAEEAVDGDEENVASKKIKQDVADENDD